MAAVNGPEDGAGWGERMVKFWIAEMGRIWCMMLGGEVAIARRFVKGQTVNRLPSRVGKKGVFVIKRILCQISMSASILVAILMALRTF